MSKKSKGGLFRRMGHALDKLTGSSSSTVPSSPQAPSSAPPQIAISSSEPVVHSSVTPSQLPLPPSPQPALAISAPPSPAPSIPTLPPPVFALSVPSLQIPSILQDPALASNGSALWSSLGSGLRTLHTTSTLFPPVQSAIGSLLLGVESFEESAKNRKEYESLVLELKTLSETLDQHLRGSPAPPMLDFIAQTVQLIQKQVDIIAQAEKQHSVRRVFEAETVRDALATCDRSIQTLSRQIHIKAGLHSESEQQASTGNAQTGREIAQIEALKPAKLAMYDSSLATEVDRRACTENTRVGVLMQLENWLKNPNAPNVCWMNGMAGTGKTTIAYTFAKSLESREQLGASFFCTRTTEDCRDVNRIIPTIAYQLARHSSQFRSALCRVLIESPDLTSRTLSTQFDRLLKDPLMDVRDTMIGIPLQVVVIDALDECGSARGVELVLDTLLRSASQLPLRFFVASRPEPNIRNRIQDQPESLRSVFELHSVKQSDVRADIELYLAEELPFISQSQVKQLAELAGVLFIYAATAARYIQAGELTGDLDESLEMMLSVTPSDEAHAEIDQLYTTVLSAADDVFVKKDIKDRMRLVLWTAVCAREPVSVETLAALAGIRESKKALAMLQPLRSILYVAGNGNTISTLHASFPDFLFNQSRSASFFCDTIRHNQLVAEQCFMIMKAQLRFNICGLESSHIADEVVPDLVERLSHNVSPTLAYTCRYWADHLQETTASDPLSTYLHGFLLEQLLFWMEVMNLKHWMGMAVRSIVAAKVWLIANHPSSDLRLVEDARKFATSFAANTASRSTPHIYVSALALCHRSSAVYNNYWRRTHGLIEPKGPGVDRREAMVLASWPVDSRIHSIAYSPDGTRLAVGCRDGNVVVKDAYDGTLIGAPLTGHTAEVVSVAFSPDGQRIVSGGDDHSVRVWSDLDEIPISSCFEGHTEAVTSVAFSPDGACAASGSHDRTIRIWNTHDGTLVHPPFEGHTDVITSVGFSPDGKHIASGSYDMTVRIWDVHGGIPVGPPFEGHTNGITSVAFSSDSRHIASGSWDCTIILWDMHDRSAARSPLEGHNNMIASVAFSPDGSHIISGSWDKTIRIWNISTGTLVGSPFEGHTKKVTSVAVSPDGTRVASGSNDCSVRVWNLQDITLSDSHHHDHTGGFTSLALSSDGSRLVVGTESGVIRMLNTHGGAFISVPFTGHSKAVDSVAFSPDGTHLVSGSRDLTIRIWGVNNGVLIGVPLEGHTEAVKSVAFSPDGTRIASGSDDHTIRIWSVPDGTLTTEPLRGHTGYVFSVAFSPTAAQIVSGSSDDTVRVWNVQNGTLAGTPHELEEHTSWVRSTAFSPDGTTIASGSDDCTICLWNAQDGALIRSLEGHTDYISSVAFSPDGTRIASGSCDHTVRVWDVQRGALIGAPLQGHTDDVLSVAFSPDGACIYSMSKKSIRCWDLARNTPEADTWAIAKDGWVTGPESQLHFWIPQDLVPIFPTPHNRWAISENGAISFDYDNLPTGNSWKGCYSMSK